MGDHVFLDESKRDTYVMVAVNVPPSELTTLRGTVRAARVPGTRRLHFRAERDVVRKAFLSVLRTHDVAARVYVVEGRRDLAARELILAERDESTLAHDERVVKRERARLRATDALRYDAVPAVAEPLLWIPDAIAWAWCRNHMWRSQVHALVREVVHL